MLEMNTSEYR